MRRLLSLWTQTSPDVFLLASLHFWAGFAWAVQRPQGFLLVLLHDAGFSEEQVGLISLCGLVAPIFGGPITGFVADRLAPQRRYVVLAATALLRAAFQTLAWPCVSLVAQAPTMCFLGCLVAITVASFVGASFGVLCDLTLQCVGNDGFGRVRLWGGIGFGIGSLVTGLLADSIPRLGLQVAFLESLIVAFFTTISAQTLGMIQRRADAILVGADAHRDGCAADQHLAVGVGGCREEVGVGSSTRCALLAHHLFKFKTISFFLVVFSLGLGEGTMQEYTYTRLAELPHGTSLVMGLSAAFMIASEIPCFNYSGALAKRFGVMPILTLALVCMALRQAWISVIWDAAWVLPGELLHGITYSVANAAAVLHCAGLAPDGLGSTFQSIQQVVFDGLGQGFAALIGAAIIARCGTIALFIRSACFAATSALLPAALWLLERRRA